MESRNRLISRSIGKKVIDAIIYTRVVIIISTLFIVYYFLHESISNTFIEPWLYDLEDLRKKYYEFLNNLLFIFLPSMIIPGTIVIVTTIPVRILMNRKMKILINAHQKKQHRISLMYRREGFKLENKRDFLHQVYKGF